MKEIADAYVQYQKLVVEELEKFKAGVFPERFGKCFEVLYKQATSLIDGDYLDALQQYLPTITTATLEQYDKVSDQYVDGDSEAFKDSTMWTSVYTHRHLFELPPSQKWSELFAVVVITTLANSIGEVREATSQLMPDKLPDDWRDFDIIAAGQIVQLAQLARYEETIGFSSVEVAQLQAEQIKSRDASRRVSQRWVKSKQRVVLFDSYLDEDSEFSKNEQARRFVKSLTDEMKPEGDDLELQVKSLVNAHRRFRKKWDIGEN